MDRDARQNLCKTVQSMLGSSWRCDVLLTQDRGGVSIRLRPDLYFAIDISNELLESTCSSPSALLDYILKEVTGVQEIAIDQLSGTVNSRGSSSQNGS